MENVITDDTLREALARVLCRMDTKGEGIQEAIESVADDFDGGCAFKSALLVYAQGSESER